MHIDDALSGQLQADLQGTSGPAVLVGGASLAGEFVGQDLRQAQAGGVEDVDALEAVQQRQGLGLDLATVVEGLAEQLLEEGDGLGRADALAEGVGREVSTVGVGKGGQLLEGGLGMVEPAEDQGLGQAGALEFTGAADQAGLAGQGVGIGEEQGLQDTDQGSDTTDHGILVRQGVGEMNSTNTLRTGAPFGRSQYHSLIFAAYGAGPGGINPPARKRKRKPL